MTLRRIAIVYGAALWQLAVLSCWVNAVMATALENATKSAVPAARRQAEIRKVIDETFEFSKANNTAKKQAAAEKLTEMIADPATSSDELYVALQVVLDLHRDCGDFSAYATALQKLTDSFQVDPIVEKTSHITEFMAASKSSTVLEPAVA